MNKIAKYIIWAGVLLVIVGFIYDSVFAGIPYQDPPPDLQLEYERDVKIALRMMESGLIIAVIGIVLKVAAVIQRRSKIEKQ